MKYAKYFAIALASIAVGCTGNFEDLNTSPNAVTVGGLLPQNMLEPLLIDGANTLMTHMYERNNEIVQMTVASTSNVDFTHRYVLADAQFIVPFREYYRRGTDAKHMYDLATTQEDPNYQAMGLTLKVFYLSKIADLYGSIAYTEALRGSEGILKPKIESQQEAFSAMFEELELANSLYNTSASLAGKDKDALYAGDLAKWQKFTNTLHLRLLMRVSGRNNDFSPSVGERIAAIINNPAKYPIFESNDDSAAVQYSGADLGHRNKFNTTSYPTENGFAGDHLLTEQLLKMTVDDSGEVFDPRIRIWGKPRSVDDYKWRGTPGGCSSDFGNNNRQYGSYMHYETLVRDDNPNFLMDYTELLFIKAEAALKGWIAGDPKAYYEDAITSSCQKWNVFGAYGAFPNGDGTTAPVNITAADIAKLLADPRIAYNAANAEQLIAEQKWLALFWVAGFEQFSEMRRTGYPAVTIGRGAVERDFTGGKFPARFAYPTIAIGNNYDNYMAAIADQKGNGEADNTMMLPVWWSGQAIARDNGNPWPHAFRTLTQDNR